MGADDVPPTGAVLMAAHKYLGTRCTEQNKAFMACKTADRNPETCLAKGAAVTSCSVNTLKELNTKCGKELDAYASCLDWNGNKLEKCRKEQAALEKACPL